MLPTTQYAIQLVGPGELILNANKPVDRPGPFQILARVEAVGLCFSDLKLLKQFSAHARKSEVLSGADPEVLGQIPSYCPGHRPGVPGHEAACRIVAVGDRVVRYAVGQRVLVQTDYRWLPTQGSNAAFGYNFEGALQQYVLMDERIIVDPATGEGFLIPVPDTLSASAVALVEPWACVESAYVTQDRRTLKAGGRLLVVLDQGRQILGLQESMDPAGKPASITIVGTLTDGGVYVAGSFGAPTGPVRDLADLADASFDDIVYFGTSKEHLDVLNDKLACGGILNIVLGGRTIGRPVSVGVGRVHYGLCRWIGTTGADASESYHHIPKDGEVRDGERVAVIGAAGPMGQMHTVRLVCAGKNLHITATDLDQARLDTLAQKASPLALRRDVDLEVLNTQTAPMQGPFDYVALMVPVAGLVQQAIEQSRPDARINVFAGIPAPVKHDLDLDRYIANRCYMFGTSGSRLEDMKIVLDKVVSGQLDTNVSVDAVSGMAGARDGIKAVEDRTLSGKIIVYPTLPDMPLTALTDLGKTRPDVVLGMEAGLWTRQAEQRLVTSNP